MISHSETIRFAQDELQEEFKGGLKKEN